MTTTVKVDARTKKVAPRPKRGRDNSKQDTVILVTVVRDANVVAEKVLKDGESLEEIVADAQYITVREIGPDDPWWERKKAAAAAPVEVE